MSDPQALLAAAVEARRGAYAPYSAFRVGAALLGGDGRVWTGANVENASYGLSMCAERTALFHAVASGARGFTAIAVAGPEGVPTLPCGACRQVLWEFAPELDVLCAQDAGVSTTPLAALLPLAFDAGRLGEARAR